MKRIILFVIIPLLFAYNNCISAITDEKVGDINGDNEVNNKDLDLLIKYITEDGTLNETEKENVRNRGDINHDGRVTAKDSTELESLIKRGATVTGASDATSCAGFHTPNSCKVGKGKNSQRFSCVWNEKYKFCSPNGLVYLSCGNMNNKTDAHDIPVLIPRLTSYGVTILKVGTPVILIIISMFQLIKAIASQNEDEMKKAQSSLIKKLVISAIIFFVATIVQFVIKQVALDDELGSSTQCLSCFVNNDCNGAMYFVDGYGYCYFLSDKYTPVATTTGKCRTDIGILNGLVSDDNTNSDSNNSISNNSKNNSNSNSNSKKTSDSAGESKKISDEEICVLKRDTIEQIITPTMECHTKQEWEDSYNCKLVSKHMSCKKEDGTKQYSIIDKSSLQ